MVKTKIIGAVIAVTALCGYASEAYARNQIRAVGSSTVYPFVTVAAEAFGKKTSFKTPIIESTGTGGGFKLFCAGVGEAYPDLSNASRAIKKSEVKMCESNGVSGITEIKIGYDGIVIANSIVEKHYDLTLSELFLALARQVPVKGKLVENPNKKWSDVNKSLPNVAIEVYGPPPTSGTRDAFVELVMEKACKDLPAFKEAYPDKKKRKKACHLLREDGAFIEAGENDNLIVQKLVNNPYALGIFGFSFLEQNADMVRGSSVNGVIPDFEHIADGSYPISRPLFVYVKNEHIPLVRGLKEFTEELTNESAMGEEGYLSERGLIPLPQEEYEKVRNKVLNTQ